MERLHTLCRKARSGCLAMLRTSDLCVIVWHGSFLDTRSQACFKKNIQLPRVRLVATFPSPISGPNGRAEVLVSSCVVRPRAKA